MKHLGLVIVALLAWLSLAQGVAPTPALSIPVRRPNIVFVLTDDLSWNLVQYMPHVLKMQKDGVTFTNYFAPHAPYTPAPRDADALPGLRAPRTPAFDAAPDANAPKWLSAHPPLSIADMTNIDRDFRKRAQSVLAVDAMIGELQAAVAAIGAEDNTYFIFSSDNGYHMGEHRLRPGKMTPYDTDILVPLIVTGPGVAAGRTVEEIVMNIDLYPTFTELAGAAVPAGVDGRSLVPLLHGQKVTEWRTAALVEHHGPHNDPSDPDAPAARSGNPTTYEAIRMRTSLYVEYADGEKEYHDLSADPYELRNTFSTLSSQELTSLRGMLKAMSGCHGARSCWLAERPMPQ